ncbi:hypothetical protein Desti_5306 [Desulfomonile tiedjei DSM 6799]|uniref:Uncharacterized protein n=1 Tax=Desulfomonile tiedjei (strain ATCC 49306 / DSM 6799 / DCB-1) TaxID=706587 RepID=I4CEA4_DESTA|nr:hypothetical protein Desti_5306 [Desulfomonile tiedjei DSM 6799]
MRLPSSGRTRRSAPTIRPEVDEKIVPPSGMNFDFCDSLSLPVHSIDIIDYIQNVPARRPAPTNILVPNRTFNCGNFSVSDCMNILDSSGENS